MMQYTDTAKVFKAYADENRLSILSMLTEGEKCACVLLSELNISQSTLSHHMKLLTDAGVVRARKEGKWTHYSLSEGGPHLIKQALSEFEEKAKPRCCGSKDDVITDDKKALFKEVQERYTRAAQSFTTVNSSQKKSSSCCTEDAEVSQTACCGESAQAARSFAASDMLGARLYIQEGSAEIENLPEDALLASLGCGNPTAVADLREGEVVLDLGSGGGIDVLLSAARVGTSGFAYGLDMTDEMLDLARKNAREAHATNVEFLKGRIEDIPLEDSSIDVVISNCVINLSIDKPAVFSEMARVLKPGGRIGVSDVVSSNELTPEERRQRGDYAGCIAGSLSFEEYENGLRDAGFSEISITPTHEVADGIFASIVKAVR